MSPVQSPAIIPPNPSTPSPPSSNSSSRASTIKRSSFKDVPSSPSAQKESAKETETPKPTDVDIPKKELPVSKRTIDDDIQKEEKLAEKHESGASEEEDDILENGKVLTRKGKQVGLFSFFVSRWRKAFRIN